MRQNFQPKNGSSSNPTKVKSSNEQRKPVVVESSRHHHHGPQSYKIEKEIESLPRLKVKFPDGKKCKPDFIIVGLGAGGAVMARELCRQGYRVIAFESGKDRLDDPIIKYPFDVSRFRGDQEYGLNLLNALFDCEYSYFEGNPSGAGEGWNLSGTWSAKMNGGSTGHYYCVMVDPMPEICDGPTPSLWKTPGFNARFALKEAGGPDWSYSKLHNIIKGEIEDFSLPFYFSPGNPPLPGFSEDLSMRGYGGPHTITQFDGPSTSATGNQETMLKAFSLGANDLDVSYGCGPAPIVDDYNLPINANSVSQLQWAMRLDQDPGKPVRQYAASSFLGRDFLTPEDNGVSYGVGSNMIVVFNSAQVVKLSESKHRGRHGNYKSNGVEVDIGNTRYLCKGKNVIVCASAGKTPRILERSGIGNPDILNKYNVPVRAINRRIGENLSNQYGPRIVISCNNGGFANNFYAQSFLGYKGKDRVFQTIHVSSGVESFGRLTHDVRPDPSRHYFALEGFMCNPRSSGMIHITEANSQGNSGLDWQFFTDGPDPYDTYSGLSDDESDIYRLCVHMEYMYKTFKRMQSLDPGSDFQLDDPPESIFLIANRADRFEAMVPYLKAYQVVAAHESGTCSMNNDPNIGAVNGHLRVHKTDNVFVGDTSFLPIQNGGNTSMLMFAAAMNGARLIPLEAIGI